MLKSIGFLSGDVHGKWRIYTTGSSDISDVSNLGKKKATNADTICIIFHVTLNFLSKQKHS